MQAAPAAVRLVVGDILGELSARRVPNEEWAHVGEHLRVQCRELLGQGRQTELVMVQVARDGRKARRSAAGAGPAVEFVDEEQAWAVSTG